MDKKKLIIGGIVCLVVVLAVVLILVLGGKKKEDDKKDDNKVASTVTLDINPSLEMDLNSKKEVLDVRALNGDANAILEADLKGKSWDDALKGIADKIVEHGFADADQVVMIINVTGEAKGEELSNGIRHVFGEKNLDPDVIVIEDISEEDKELAKQYNITPAKAAYINTVTKENTNVTFEQLVEKPVKELKETKETGKYCDEGYNLEGDFCVREKERVAAIKSSVCPKDTEEVKGICYKRAETEKEPYCKNGLTLKDGKCVGTEEVNAEAKCSEGTYNSKTGKCESSELKGEGTKTCNEEHDKLLSNGKCAAAHPGAHTYGDNDEPFDEATECCCGDTFDKSNGWCYSLPNGNYDAKVTCPSGQTAKDGKCYEVKTSEPTYSCSKGNLNGNKCTVEVSKNPEYKASCKNGLTLHENRVCIDKNSTVEKEEGYSCKQKDSKLEGDQCVVMEIVDAKQ